MDVELRRKFAPKMEEVTGRRRQLYNEELHKSYFFLNIIRVIKWRKIEWAVRVTLFAAVRQA